MLGKFKNSKKQGNAGIGIAISWFALNGYTVSIPLTDAQDYDLVVDMCGLKKVQVKTTTTVNKSGAYQVYLRVAGGNRSGIGKIKNFNNKSVDFVFVVTAEEIKYLIPSKVIRIKNQLSLNKKMEVYIINNMGMLGSG